jgi:hypothetical protein
MDVIVRKLQDEENNETTELEGVDISEDVQDVLEQIAEEEDISVEELKKILLEGE